MNLPLYREFESTHFISILLIYEVLFVVLLTSECCCGSTWIQRFCSCLFLVLFPFPYFKGCFNLHILSCFNFCDSVICRILSISCKDFHFNRLPIFFLSPYFFKIFFVILITSFTSCLSSSKTLTYISLFFSLSNHGLYFPSCIHTCIYVHIHVSIDTTSSIYIILLVCLFSGFTI